MVISRLALNCRWRSKKVDNYYDAETNGEIYFKIPELNIEKPIEFNKAITSEKDAKQ